VVPPGLQFAHRLSCCASFFQIAPPVPAQSECGSSPPALHEVNRLSFVRQSLTTQSLSGAAAHIIEASWKPSTSASYASAFRRWSAFCRERSVDISTPSIPNVIEFLTGMFHDGHSFSHINVARSALSSTLSLDGFKLGDHPLISRFMAGVRNLRSPAPKYPVFWNATDLLSYLKSWNIDSHCLRDVSHKLVTIVACLSVQRVHTVTNIDFNVQFLDTATYLYVFKDLKVARARPCFVIALPALRDADALGSAELLRLYLQLTKDLRPRDCRQLFISYVKPHRPVSNDTVARWIRGVLAAAGIASQFGAHSVRGSSASVAHASVPLDDVLKLVWPVFFS